jgi:hypothetical protein
VVAHPEVTPFSCYFRVGGDSGVELCKPSSDKSATCLDFHLSTSDSAIVGSSRSSSSQKRSLASALSEP